MGVGIKDGFFKKLYERFARGERTVDQVLFYEIARNYWMADMNPAIDYHTSKGPQDYGWWTVGFNNAMSIFLPSQCDYFGLRLPKASRGGTMIATWFDPLTGKFSDPIRQEITQWPSLEVPGGDRFRLLVVRTKT